MDALTAVLGAQLADPFRIGLILFLALTARRTAGQTGQIVPLALGVMFVAVMLATTFRHEGRDWMLDAAIGLVANLIILGIVLAGIALFQRVANRNGT